MNNKQTKTYYFKVKYKNFTFIRTATGLMERRKLLISLFNKGYWLTNSRRLQILSIKCFWEIDKPTNYKSEKEKYVGSLEYIELLDKIHARLLQTENL